MRAKALWSRLAELADEDSAAYAAFMADRTDETRARIVAVPEEIAVCADEVAALAERRARAAPQRGRRRRGGGGRARPGGGARGAHGSPS